jgi:hypothetical protein
MFEKKNTERSDVRMRESKIGSYRNLSIVADFEREKLVGG